MAGVGLLHFILHTQKDIVPHLSNPVRYQRDHHLSIDANTRRSLEIIKLVNSYCGSVASNYKSKMLSGIIP